MHRTSPPWADFPVRPSLAALGLALAALALGCGQATAPAPRAGDTPRENVSAELPTPGANPAAEDDPESAPNTELLPATAADEVHWWFVTQVEGHPVGYVHVRRGKVLHRGRQLLQWQAEHRLRLQRFGQRTETQLHYWSLEEPTGRVIAFGARVDLGGEPQQCRAQRQGDAFLLRLRRGRHESVRRLPAGEEVRGFFALFQLKPDRERLARPLKIRQLHPVFLQVVPVEVRYDGQETLSLQGRSRSLHRLRAVMQVGPQQMEQVMWLDSSGEVYKTRSTGPGLVEVNLRSGRQQALAVWNRSPRWDLGRAVSVRVNRDLPPAKELARVRYRLRVPPRAAFQVPQLPLWQELRAGRPGEYELTVYSARRLRRTVAGPPLPGEAQEVEEFLKPSPLVDSDHPQVVALARSVLPQAEASWPLAAALQRVTHERIASKEFSLAMASASEALERGRGDCTEHAVLLAALARARGIPARLAYGLVYLPGSRSFAFHMWTELWLHGRWVPWDAAWNEPFVGPDHILLGHARLRSPEDWSSLLPLVEILGRLELEVMEVVRN